MHKHDNIISEQRQDLRLRILNAATPLFKQKSIKTVRMDDIANTLSISKRTLYEVYRTKEELLLACIKFDYERMHSNIQDYSLTAENELDVVVTYFKMKFADLDNISPNFLTELEKYDSVISFLRQKHEEQQKDSILFIRQCIENGYFIPTINYTIIQDICDLFVSTSLTDVLYEKYSLRDIFLNFFFVLLRGFCTEKGINLLDQYLKKNHF